MRGESFVANNLQVSENGRSGGSGKKTVGRSVGGLTLALVGQTSLCNRSVGAGRTGGNLQIVSHSALSSHRTLPLIFAFYVS